MPTHWCANFDNLGVLQHGLSRHCWCTQYQYEHGGFEYQGNIRQKARTTVTWNSLTDVSIGDYIIAYLRPSKFFAVGQICKPRKVVKKAASALYTDKVSRTTDEWEHLHFDGIVRYSDAPAFYEDFTDHWSFSTDGVSGIEPPSYPYAQRIDVVEWEHVVPNGVPVAGLSVAAPLPDYRKPIFQVKDEFFTIVKTALCAAASKKQRRTKR